jgi:hypothetical protein
MDVQRKVKKTGMQDRQTLTDGFAEGDNGERGEPKTKSREAR